MKDEEKKGRIITEDTKKMNKEFKAKKAQAMIEKHDD
jgi:ubiquitin C-terminal hydrolase